MEVMGGNPSVPSDWIANAVADYEARDSELLTGDLLTPISVLDAPQEGDVLHGYALGGHVEPTANVAYVSVILGGELVRIPPGSLARARLLSGECEVVDEATLFPGIE